mmetsp:Transcript_10342/g.41871  ORF Transcript_10342/g.41871 Transcript_10342/m.41871 type:complete len:135 (-) Transcript_10342:24-428(-)
MPKCTGVQKRMIRPFRRRCEQPQVHCHILEHEDEGMMSVYRIAGEEGTVYEGAEELDPTCYRDESRGYSYADGGGARSPGTYAPTYAPTYRPTPAPTPGPTPDNCPDLVEIETAECPDELDILNCASDELGPGD